MPIQIGAKGVNIAGVAYPPHAYIDWLDSAQEAAAVQGGDAYYVPRRTLDPAEVAAVRAVVAGLGTTAKSPAPSSIELPSYVSAAWWPLNDGAGTAPVDAVQGLVAEAVGTTTQLWDNAGYATLAADTAIRIRNNAVIDELMRLDTLQGSLIVGMEILGGAPGATVHAWGYGDNGETTAGGFSGSLPVANVPQVVYCGIGGPTAQTHANNLAGLLKAKNRRFFHWVFHSLDGRFYADGYEAGWHSRSSRVRALEGVLPAASTTRGLRIGARPTGAAGGSTNYVGAQIASAQIANWHAIRVAGDYRHLIPGWIDNLCATMPYGAIPKVLSNG